MELVKNAIGIYFFQKDSYLNFMKKSLLPVPYAILLICISSLSSAYINYIQGKTSWLIWVIRPLLSLFLAYLLADIVHSQGKRELLEEPTTKTLFCLYSLFTIPGFIISLINKLLFINYSSAWLLLIIIIFISLTIYLSFRWYFFGIKTLFELSWINSLKLGIKAYLIYTLCYLLIMAVLYFFAVTLGLIDLPQPYYYKFLFGL